MVDAEIFRNRGIDRRSARFDTLVLRFAADNDWNGAMWELMAGGGMTRLPVEPIEEITAIAGSFDVIVVDGQGNSTGPLRVQSAICGYPVHSFCFLFRVEDDELWAGHTVSRAFGKIAVVPYRFDPS